MIVEPSPTFLRVHDRYERGRAVILLDRREVGPLLSLLQGDVA
jgi:hypothetical protein